MPMGIVRLKPWLSFIWQYIKNGILLSLDFSLIKLCSIFSIISRDIFGSLEILKLQLFSLDSNSSISLGKKFTNGFIRNGHDVLEISDRDFVRQNRSFSLKNIIRKILT